MKMRAVVYDAVGATPAVREIDIPDCPPDGVVVQVRATGLCRSDWHAWRGHEAVPLPQVPGHELAGVIAQVGTAVSGFDVGERVTTPFVNGCGRCDYCVAGDTQICPDQTQPGFTGPGSFAEYVVVQAAETNLVRLPDGIDFAAAALLGCRFATAYRALTVHGRIQPGDQVVVLGVGGVGLSAVMIAAAYGAQVTAVDTSPAALNAARDLGALHLLQPGADDLAPALIAATNGGAHVCVDALGRPELLRLGLNSLRRRGRHVQIGLLFGGDANPEIPMDLVIARELELYGSHGMATHEYGAMLAVIGSGVVDPGRLVSQTITLDEAPAALMAMDHPAPTAGVTMITF